MGAVSSAVVHRVSVKSRMPKLRTHLSQNDWYKHYGGYAERE